MNDSSIAPWIVAAIGGFLAGIVGYHLGYSAAMCRTIEMIEMLRAETEAYLNALGLADREKSE